MIRASLLLPLSMMPGLFLVQADDADVKRVVKAKAEKINDAFLKGDYAAVVAGTYPRIVEQLGGREEAARVFKAARDEYQQKGLELKAVTTGEPSRPIKGGRDLFVVVPISSKLISRQGKVLTESSMLAISPDDGKTWTFLHVPADTERLRRSLPQLPREITFPKQETKVVPE
jgi:hypothetical protein